MTGPALALSAELATSLATPPDTRDIELRHGMLKKMAQSPAHCRHAIISGWEDQNLTRRLAVGKNLLLGSAVHSLILGGPEVVPCGFRRNTNDFKKTQSDNPDAILLSLKDFDKATSIAAAIKADDRASRILYAPGAIYEQTIRWEWLGRKRRTTPDVRNFSIVAELKTAADASPDRFKWQCIRLGYHAQIADQLNAIEAETGHRPREAFMVVVETAPPYVPIVYRLTANDLEAGERMNRAWMERLAICEATNQWPGYSETIMDLDLPSGDDEVVFTDDDGEEVADEGSGL